MLRYLQTAPTFENNHHKKAWLLHVAANLCKNKLSYNKIRNTDELEEDLIANEREDLTFVWDAIKKLPNKYREVTDWRQNPRHCGFCLQSESSL